MTGMDEVGRLFNANELIVAEVLQSAEAMKAAVAYLEPFMEKTDSATKGAVILATVKGDVHDIGKNLVEIILGNNGFRVVNLGIKVPPEELIAAYRSHRPDLIGLSGLVVKSAQQMVVTAEDLRAAGVRCPVLVGGAALSAKFTAAKIAPAYGQLVCYANDAMRGLDLANKLVDARTREATAAEVQAAQKRLREAPAAVAQRAAPAAAPVIRHDQPIPTPPDLKRHVVDRVPLEEIFPYVNPAMLYGKHLGLRGNLEALPIEGAEALAELLHRRLREMWGFPDAPDMTTSERFKARYRGVRVSFGYPACPRLEDQEKLFRVLDVEGTIGIRLTEGYMMDPEASVSALVFHHPEARYFVIPPGDLEAFERRLAAGG